MSSIIPESGEELRRFLEEKFQEVEEKIDANAFELRVDEPQAPQIGKLYKASGDWDPGDGPGYYVYTGTEYESVGNSQQKYATIVTNVYYEDTEPVGSFDAGDYWIDTNADPEVAYYWDGSAWVLAPATDAFAQNILQARASLAVSDGVLSTFLTTVEVLPGNRPVAQGTGDIWIDQFANRVWRWNGASWIDTPYDVASWTNIQDDGGKPADNADVTEDSSAFQRAQGLGSNGANVLRDPRFTQLAADITASLPVAEQLWKYGNDLTPQVGTEGGATYVQINPSSPAQSDFVARPIPADSFNQMLAIAPNQTFYVSAEVYVSSALNGTALLGVFARDQAGTVLTFPSTALQGLTRDSWQTVNVAFSNTTANIAWAQFWLSVRDDATAGFVRCRLAYLGDVPRNVEAGATAGGTIGVDVKFGDSSVVGETDFINTKNPLTEANKTTFFDSLVVLDAYIDNLSAGQINIDGATLVNDGGAIRVDAIAANQVSSGEFAVARIPQSGLNVLSMLNAPAEAGATNGANLGSNLFRAGGTVVNQTDLVGIFNKLGAGNVSSFIDNLAIGNAYIAGDLNASKITAGQMSSQRIIIDGVTLTRDGDALRVNEISADVVTSGVFNADRINIDGVTLTASGDQLVINDVPFDLVSGSTRPEDNASNGLREDEGVRNPNFERGLLGWTAAEGAADFSLNQVEQLSGSNCIEFSGTDGAIQNDAWFAVAPKDKLRLRGWVKTSSNAVFTLAGVQILWYGQTFNNFISSSLASISSVDMTWQQLEVIASPPAGATLARVRFVINGVFQGEIFFDRMSLVIGQKERIYISETVRGITSTEVTINSQAGTDVKLSWKAGIKGTGSGPTPSPFPGNISLKKNGTTVATAQVFGHFSQSSVNFGVYFAYGEEQNVWIDTGAPTGSVTYGLEITPTATSYNGRCRTELTVQTEYED